jgi:HlyD family secretion protein
MRKMGGRFGGIPHSLRRLAPRNDIKLRHTVGAVLVMALALTGCHKEASEKEPEVPVQVVAVQKTTLQHTVTAEGILFPLQQAAITPKTSAPVKAFYVKRGDRVRKDELLAILENRDLAAAAQDTKGTYEQAQATYTTTTAAIIPEELQKASLDLQAAKALLDAQEKIYSSRQELFQQGAMPRKELDQAGVDVTNARNQYKIAQKHYDSLMAIGQATGIEVGGGAARIS